jgi:hypothetical protein
MFGMLANNRTPVKQNTWLDYLHRTLDLPNDTGGEAVPRISEFAFPDWQARDGSVDAQEGPRAEDVAREQVKINVRAVLDNIAPLPRSETPAWKRATDFIPEDQEALVPPAQAGAVSPLLRGTVFHRCLELFSKTGAYDLDTVIEEHPDILALGREDVLAFKNDIVVVLGEVLDNAAHAWIFEQSDSAYSELPFLHRKEHAIISGIVDRVVIKNGKGYVIDFKSILVGNDDALGSWRDHYRPQIAIYCEAVKEIFQLERVEGHLLFLDSNRLVQVV